MMKIKWFFLCMMFTIILKSQPTDFGLWLGITGEKEVFKKLDASFGFQLRYNNDISNIRGYYYAAGLKYKHTKWLSSMAEFRLTTNENKDVWRLSGGVAAKSEINDLTISFRQLLQKDFQSWSYHPEDKGLLQTRSKLELTYNTSKKLGSYISAESFISFFYQPLNLYRMRYIVGLKYKVNKSIKLNADLIYQTELYNTGNVEERKVVPTFDVTFGF